MKSIKAYATTIAAGVAIAAASALAVAGPASASPVQHGPSHVVQQAPHRPAPARATDPGQSRSQYVGRQQAQARKEQAAQRTQQAAEGTDPGSFLPDPPVITEP